MVVPHKRTRSDVLLTRSPLAIREQALYAAVRLACVKHAASVQSEPGSNSSVQSLFFRPFVKRDRFADYSRRNWSGSFVAFSIFLCFKPWARDKSLCLVCFSRPLLCSFRFLSPRSRLSVRCLVFKELFVAAVAATRSKFYFISFRLVKSFSKNFCFSFRSLLRNIVSQ